CADAVSSRADRHRPAVAQCCARLYRDPPTRPASRYPPGNWRFRSLTSPHLHHNILSLRTRMPPVALQHDSIDDDLLRASHAFADRIDIRKAAFLDGKNRRIARRTRTQRAKLWPANSDRGVCGRRTDHIRDRHAETQEF